MQVALPLKSPRKVGRSRLIRLSLYRVKVKSRQGWKAIEPAEKAGCGEYDLFGVSRAVHSSYPRYGLYRCKKGLVGNLFRRQGCRDYPLDEGKYFP